MSKSVKVFLAVCALLIAGAVALIVVSQARARQRQETYSNAYALYKKGQYEEAAELYAKLKDETWIEKCDLGIAERDAQALYEAGKPDEALALLRERAPEGELRAKLAEDYAAALIESEDYEAALAVLESDAPGSETIARCERVLAQIDAEQAFREQAVAGHWHEANESLEQIEAMNGETGRLTGNELKAMGYVAEGDYGSWCVADGLIGSTGSEYVRRTITEVLAANGHYSNAISNYKELGDEDGIRATLEAMKASGDRGTGMFMAYEALGDTDGMRQEAEWMLSSGEYGRAYDAYETLGDEDGKRAVIDAQAAAGQIVEALGRLIEIEDYEQADALLDRFPAEGSLLSDSGSGSGFACGDALDALLQRGDDAALALAARMVDKLAEECRAAIAQEKRCVPYYALGEVKARAESLWTDELEALQSDCPQPFPEASGILKQSWTAKSGDDGGGTASITVHNGKKAAILRLNQVTKTDFVTSIPSTPTGNYIAVYIRPNDRYTFELPGGYYDAYVMTGNEWFGEREGFGYRCASADVSIGYNPYNPQQGQRLEGSYSLSLE